MLERGKGTVRASSQCRVAAGWNQVGTRAVTPGLIADWGCNPVTSTADDVAEREVARLGR